MNIKIFGQLVDIIGSSAISINDIADTENLISMLQSEYPPLRTSKYKIAVNRNIIQSNTALQPDAEIALLPPFSGG